MDKKKQKYLKIFKAEADEHLSCISRRLLELESGNLDEEAINELLRSAHTLKGSARMVGLAEIGEIGHKMEDIMKAVQDGELPMDAVVVDRMLEGSDAIGKLMDPEGDTEVNVEDLVARLVAVLEGGDDKAAPSEENARGDDSGEADEAAVASGVDSSSEEFFPEVLDLSAPVIKDGPGPGPGPETAPPAEPETPAPAKPPEKKPEEKKPEEKKPDEAKKSQKAKSGAQVSDTLRVPAAKLDRLIDYSGELTISKIKLEGKSFTAKKILESMNSLLSDLDEIAAGGGWEQARARIQEVRNVQHEFAMEMAEDVIELEINVEEIQNGSLQLRMIPASTLFDEFPRMVRDLARELGKEIALEVIGQDTELDKRLLEQLRGPLIHIIRNACDHGLETPEAREARGKPRRGTVQIHAYHQGSLMIIEVSDDGKGMDADRILETAVSRGLIDRRAAGEMTEEEVYYLTLRPGFSTSEIITDVSGRGVGMDVVKTNVEALRGDLNISSKKGEGTTISLQLPLTVSIVEALLVSQGGEIYAIPLSAVDEVVKIKHDRLVLDRGRETVPVRGKLVPLVRLGRMLRLEALPDMEEELKPEKDTLTLILLRFRNQRLALEVDQAMREQEILVKPLGHHLSGAPMVSGATILRKGEPALILNVFDIFAEAERIDAGGGRRGRESARDEDQGQARVMVVDDSITTRTIEKNILERAGYDVTTAVSAEDALDKLAAIGRDIDLFVVDVDMPGLSGFELTERLRANDRTMDTPVIILTSRSSDEDKRRGIMVGAQGYIVKGAFDQNVLIDTIKSLIGE